MRDTAPLILTLGVLSLFLLNGCGGGQGGVRVTEGDQQISSAPTGSMFLSQKTTIVHVNEHDRLATLRNADELADGTFLEVRDNKGNKTATLKTRKHRTGLRIADIVEGLPRINNHTVPVSASESERLREIYRDKIAE